MRDHVMGCGISVLHEHASLINAWASQDCETPFWYARWRSELMNCGHIIFFVLSAGRSSLN